MRLGIHALVVASAVVLGGFVAGCAAYDFPRGAPDPPMALYLYAPAPSGAPGSSDASLPSASASERVTAPGSSSGFPECDAYFRRSERCAAAVASSPRALARFSRKLDVARKEDRIIADSTDARAKREVAARCSAALLAYDYAPCGAPGEREDR